MLLQNLCILFSCNAAFTELCWKQSEWSFPLWPGGLEKSTHQIIDSTLFHFVSVSGELQPEKSAACWMLLVNGFMLYVAGSWICNDKRCS